MWGFEKMGFLGRFQLVNSSSHGKRHCKSLFWRMRRALKKALKNGGSGGRKHFNFHYDPSSYALNFDDGEEEHTKFQDFSDANNIVFWVYVIWVEKQQ